jgi:N-acetylneuraminic acid mutarotase
MKYKSFTKKLRKYSNPAQAQKMAYKYLGKTAKLYPANNPNKKYKIYDPKHDKWVNFGQIGYEDFTKHKDTTRRKNYLTRTKGIRGDWKRNPYSANNLSRNILW